MPGGPTRQRLSLPYFFPHAWALPPPALAGRAPCRPTGHPSPSTRRSTGPPPGPLAATRCLRQPACTAAPLSMHLFLATVHTTPHLHPLYLSSVPVAELTSLLAAFRAADHVDPFPQLAHPHAPLLSDRVIPHLPLPSSSCRSSPRALPVTRAHPTSTNSSVPPSVATSPSPKHVGKPRSTKSCPTPLWRPPGARQLNLIVDRAPLG
jgi:hypothetical protein